MSTHPTVPVDGAPLPSPTSIPTPLTTPSRPLLMIVGPTEYSPDVLSRLGDDSLPQAAPQFISDMGDALDALCRVLRGPSATPFIVSGSGSLGWDLIAANLLEPHDHALLLHTGYFSDSFALCLTAYAVTPHLLRAPIGDAPSLTAVEEYLTAHPHIRLVSFTQVDTSTALLNDVAALCAVIRRVAPHALIAVDGVCSFGGEEFRFDEWGVDAAMGCSQKALGAPPGLSLLLLSPRAVSFLSTRRTPIPGYYTNLVHWLPVMNNYRARRGSYFATPNVNLIRALLVSLQAILAYGMDRRVADHRAHSRGVQAAVQALGLRQVPVREGQRAHGLTACYYPEGVEGAVMLATAAKEGVWLSGGLHRDIAQQSFRIGHMGVSASPWGVAGEQAGKHRDDVRAALHALEVGLTAAGYTVQPGCAVDAYQAEMDKYAAEGTGR